MSELAHIMLGVGKAEYLRRLSISLAIVGASLLPAAVCFSWTSDLFVLHWGWLSISEAVPGFHFPDVSPTVLGILTITILAVAARRFRACIIATVWFVINALAATVILMSLSFDLGL
jgi:hypothetical protein